MTSVRLPSGLDFYILRSYRQSIDIGSGLEATQKIREPEDEKISGIPVIALIAETQKETKEECLQIGMNDFLSKPFMIDDLKRLIEKWTG